MDSRLRGNDGVFFSGIGIVGRWSDQFAGTPHHGGTGRPCRWFDRRDVPACLSVGFCGLILFEPDSVSEQDYSFRIISAMPCFLCMNRPPIKADGM